MTLIAPISGPLAALGRWLRPGAGAGAGASDPQVAELRSLADYYRTEYLRAEGEIERLGQTIRALQSDVPYAAASSIKRLEATRIGAGIGSGTIDVARGAVHGVTLNTVAVAINAPQHLVGVVTNVGPTVSAVHVLSDKRLAPNLLESMLIPEGPLGADALAVAPRCQLRPVGDGSLAGEIGIDAAAKVERGHLAILDDPYWPGSAQRLTIGRVVRVDDTDKPLFKKLVVRPEFDLSRVRGVVLRIPVDAAGGSAGGAPGATGGTR